ncbi:MAG TPA: T9SS type A sorting domain-containing protein, partial [Bacteroidetes bacterium]|nr:T9SS type A sorting domain-containing protein [Bacteroidota bacterium]
LSVCLVMPPLIGQVSNEPIYDFSNAHEGPYIIRTKIHFVNTSTNTWADPDDPDLDARAIGILDNLNSVFSPQGISFAITTEECGDTTTVPPNITSCSTSGPLYVIDEFDGNELPSSLVCPFVMDIFDQGDSGNFDGNAKNSPSTQIRIIGSHNGTSSGQSPLIIHEIGHALGLLHTSNFNDGQATFWTKDGCPNTSCQVSGVAYDYCCEDGVPDTDTTRSGVLVATDCSTCTNYPWLSADQFRNYMSTANGTAPNETILCNDRFSPGQVERMKTYLEESNKLSNVTLPTPSLSGTLPGGIYGNIVVETGTELEITSPIEMLPAATITVRTGGLLRIRSTITAACGGMWRGIVLDGNAFVPQKTVNQGRVILHSSGTIEHAMVGIEAQNIGANGMPVGGTGGGIVKVLAGNFVNNAISVRFGEYTDKPNVSTFILPEFTIDDAYRGSGQPVFMDMTAIVKQSLIQPVFKDLRTDCSAPRAIGVILRNAGADFQFGVFENLETGIWADIPTLSTGSLNVGGASFKNCYTGISTNKTSSFKIANSNFLLQKPAACAPNTQAEVVGVRMRGNTVGFTFSDNNFTSGLVFGDPLPAEALIGTKCIGLGDGANNVIKQNSYDNLNIGNSAVGYNGSEEGLLYLCNINSNDNPGLDANNFPIDFEVAAGATVKIDQNEFDIQNSNLLPSGNVFGLASYNFKNLNAGNPINYYFELGSTDQDPDGGPFGNTASEGINPEDVNQANQQCGDIEDPPCDLPPCTETCPDPPCKESFVSKWKNDFYGDKSEWQGKNAVLASGTLDSQATEAIKIEIGLLRHQMNKNASLVLQQYSLDTAGMETDSLLHWLAITETYPADLRLANHYFFTGDFSGFDTLWPSLGTKYGLLDAALADYQEMGTIYNLVRPHLTATGTVAGLDESTLQSLDYWADWCSEPGFLTQSILLWNGIMALPDCSNVAQRSHSGNNDGKTDKVNQAEQVLHVYPNPAGQEFNIELGQEFDELKVRLYSLQGKLVSSSSFSGLQKVALPVYEIKNGIYFLEVQTGEGETFQTKVTVQH